MSAETTNVITFVILTVVEPTYVACESHPAWNSWEWSFLISRNCELMSKTLISDSCASGKAEDTSGAVISEWINANSRFHASVIDKRCIPDDKKIIKASLVYFCDTVQPDVVLTTGGTGFSSRDVTPEATKSVLDKEAPGIVTAMLQYSLKVTPMAMLSRSASGIRGRTLIINLPGSKKGALECLEVVAPALQHAADLMQDRSGSVQKTHREVQGQSVTGHSHHVGCGGHNIDEHDGKIAYRPRSSTYEVFPVDKALDEIERALAKSKLKSRFCPSADCVGRILAEDVFASDPLPPFPASIKDGYAVLAADGVGVRKVIGDSVAGCKPGEVTVSPGFCVRINTGAPLPPGADAVVQVESTKLVAADDEGAAELEIEILDSPFPGKDIRKIGSDIENGQKVLMRGSRLGFSELGILAAVGVTKVKVYSQPSVGILSTGNELVEPGEKLQPGKIRDSNKIVLMTLLKEHGFPTVDLGIADDNVQTLIVTLKYALEKVDVLITTGGVSMGDKDLLKPVLKEHFLANIKFGRVFMKPGLPTTFATVVFEEKPKLIFALPGNPVSAAVTCHIFVVPALKKMSGWPQPLFTVLRAKVSQKINLDPRPEYQRVVLDWSSNSEIPNAHVTGNQISSRLLSVAGANGLLVLPPRTEQKPCIVEGEVVDCMVIGRV